MSNEEFRRELNNVFDNVSGSPSSNLRDRVRNSVAHPPATREPYWLAGVAAAVIAVLIVGVLYVAGPLKPGPSQVASTASTPTPTASASTAPSPSPSPSPAGFICHNQTIVDGPSQPVAYISALRTGSHPGYDRLTIEFANGAPSQVEIGVQKGTAFTLSPSGVPTTVKGQNGILVVIHGSDLHTSFTGATDVVTGYAGLAEVKRVEDFEGTVQLALGVNGASCFRVSILGSPVRYVIDVQTAS